MRFSTRTDFFADRNRLEIERQKLLRLAREGGRRLFEMSESNPSRVGLGPDPNILAQAFSDPGNCVYEPSPRGLAKARRAVAERLESIARNEGGMKRGFGGASPVEPESLVLCASTSEAYSYLFKILGDPGDAVLVPKPGYPLFDHLAALESLVPLGYPLEYGAGTGWRIDLDRLSGMLADDRAGRIRAIVLINPNNPTGSYVGNEEGREVARLCDRHGIALIADEVFHPYRLEAGAGISSFYGFEEVLTFVLDGFSKRLCLPQAKLGWISVSGPEKEKERALLALDLAADTFLSAGTPVMNAAGALLAQEPSVEAKVLDRCKVNLAAYRGILEYPGSPHRVLRCEGGWTALVRSPRFDSEEELCLELLRRKGLSVQPGHFFDMEQEAHFAFSLILRPEDARWAAQEYADFFEQYR